VAHNAQRSCLFQSRHSPRAEQPCKGSHAAHRPAGRWKACAAAYPTLTQPHLHNAPTPRTGQQEGEGLRGGLQLAQVRAVGVARVDQQRQEAAGLDRARALPRRRRVLRARTLCPRSRTAMLTLLLATCTVHRRAISALTSQAHRPNWRNGPQTLPYSANVHATADCYVYTWCISCTIWTYTASAGPLYTSLLLLQTLPQSAPLPFRSLPFRSPPHWQRRRHRCARRRRCCRLPPLPPPRAPPSPASPESGPPRCCAAPCALPAPAQQCALTSRLQIRADSQ